MAWKSSDSEIEKAIQQKDTALTAELRKARRESADLYTTARLNIAAFGDETVVEALSNYYYGYKGASEPCSNKEKNKNKSDVQIYHAFRDKLGVGGNVSDEQLANIIFLCSLSKANSSNR